VTGSQSMAAALADAISQEAVRAGGASPAVRRSDWRLAVVDTVGSDGTITTIDGIIARRMETYLDPTVGDLVAVTVSGSGSWLCWGRFGSGSGSAWTTYTPTWTTTGTAPALGNGSLAGEHTLRGDECTVRINMILGSTTTVGTGQWRWALPFPAATLGNALHHWTGSSLATDPGNAYYPGICRIASAQSLVMAISPTTATGATTGEWNNTRPFTWANGDYLGLSFTYRIA